MYRIQPSASEYLSALKKEGTARNRKHFSQQGAPDSILGVSQSRIRRLRTKLRKATIENSEIYSISKELWSSGIPEARMLAMMSCPAELPSKVQIRKWGSGITYYRVADVFVDELVMQSPHMEALFAEWKSAEGEYLLRCAYRILHKQALTANERPDDYYINEMYRLEQAIPTAPPMAREAMNDCLLSIGKRNRKLNIVALAVAKRVGTIEKDGEDPYTRLNETAAILASKKVQRQLPD